MDRKLLICLCLSPHDTPQGLELLRLWADLEETFNPAISVALCLRFDMQVDDVIQDAITHASAKFGMLIHISKRKMTGWPAGCNALENDAYEWFVESNRHGFYDFEYMLICEADTIPTRKGWANEIMNEAYDSHTMVIGCMLMRPDCPCEHINGNMVLHRDFWKKCQKIFHCSSRRGWDAYIGQEAIFNGTASKLIWQDYQLGMAHNPFRGCESLFENKFYKSERSPLYRIPIRPALIHGIKTMQGIECVRKNVVDNVK